MSCALGSYRGYVSLSPCRPFQTPLRRERRPSRISASSKEDPFPWTLSSPLLLASALVVAHHWSHPADALAALETLQHQDPHHAPVALYQVAENEDFWSNMARYSRFFVSVMIGTVYTILKPFGQLLKKPVTAAAILGGAVLLYLFISTTLKAMLGLNELDM